MEGSKSDAPREITDHAGSSACLKRTRKPKTRGALRRQKAGYGEEGLRQLRKEKTNWCHRAHREKFLQLEGKTMGTEPETGQR